MENIVKQDCLLMDHPHQYVKLFDRTVLLGWNFLSDQGFVFSLVQTNILLFRPMFGPECVLLFKFLKIETKTDFEER